MVLVRLSDGSTEEWRGPAEIWRYNHRKVSKLLIRDKEVLIVDGTRGVLIVNPDDRVLDEYRLRKTQIELERSKLRRLKTARSVTLDGVDIAIRRGRGPWPGTTSHLLFTETLVPVGAAAYLDRVRRRGRDLRRGLLDVGQRVAEQVARDGLRCGRMLDDGRRRDDGQRALVRPVVLLPLGADELVGQGARAALLEVDAALAVLAPRVLLAGDVRRSLCGRCRRRQLRSDEVLDGHALPRRRQGGADRWETRCGSAKRDSLFSSADEFARAGLVQDDDAAAIVVGAESGAAGARDEDVAEVPPAEREQAAQLGGRQLEPLDPVERGPERREVQRNAVAVLPHEVLPLLQRAVVEAQEDVEHELGELVAAVLGGAPLAAQARGIRMAMEYLNRFEIYFLTTAAQAVRFVRAVNHPSFKMMYDSFHAHIEEKEQAAEAAPENQGPEPALQPLPAWPAQHEKQLQFFQLEGYMRGRGYFFHSLDLGVPYSPSGSGVSAPYFHVPFSENPSGQGTQCAAREGKACTSQDMTSADVRLRLQPTINMGDQVRVKAQLDVFDNMVAGSTPEGFLINGLKAPTDAPLQAFSKSQAPPEIGLNSLQSAVRWKRAWAEVKTPIGELRFGRMPSHWGTGMFINDGNCLDCDYGVNVDRVMFATKLWNHFAAIAWDWVSTGPTTRLYNPNIQNGPNYSADPIDDVSQAVLAIGRQDKPEELRERVDRGDVVVNYGGYFVYRWQSWDQITNPGAGIGGATTGLSPDKLAGNLTKRGAWAFIPDLWFRLNYKKFHLEAEGVLIYGKVGNVQDQLSAMAGELTILQYAGVIKADYKLLRDALSIGLEVGSASGDPSEDPNANVFFRRAQIIRPATQNRISNFMFDPDYHVDLILFRRIVGTVTNATYFKASAAYDILDNLNARADVIYSIANVPVGWPGNNVNLGLELDASVMYHNDDEGFYAGIAYGVLFPFAGLNIPASIYGPPGFDAQTAQTVQGRLVVKF